MEPVGLALLISKCFKAGGDALHHPPANNEMEISHVSRKNHIKKDQHTKIIVKGETK
jgi:hypothetical protein